MNRYSRNITLKEVGIEGQNKFLNSKILVAGAGGLGSSVISNLMCIGIGTLGIIDYDSVEITNLNRQFIHDVSKIGINKVFSAEERIKSFNPDIKINTYCLKLTEENYTEILKNYDLVIDCFDSYESKFLLNKACVETGKVLIHGGVQEFIGQVMTIIPGKTACLACVFDDYAKNLPPKGILSPIVNIIGSIQAAEAVKAVLGQDGLLTNTILSYDCREHKLKKLNFIKSDNCSICK